MAKHGNRGGKKARGVPTQMSLRKHRSTGRTSRPRRERMLEAKSMAADHDPATCPNCAIDAVRSEAYDTAKSILRTSLPESHGACILIVTSARDGDDDHPGHTIGGNLVQMARLMTNEEASASCGEADMVRFVLRWAEAELAYLEAEAARPSGAVH